MSVFWATLLQVYVLGAAAAQFMPNRSMGLTSNLNEHMQLNGLKYTHKLEDRQQDAWTIQRKRLPHIEGLPFGIVQITKSNCLPRYQTSN